MLKIEEQYGEYEAYCFDEACAYILNEMQDEKQPRFIRADKSVNTGLELLLKE